MSLLAKTICVVTIIVAFCFLQATASDSKCVDEGPDCARYEEGHCTSNKTYAMDNCKSFCGYCDCHAFGEVHRHEDRHQKSCSVIACKNGSSLILPILCENDRFPLPHPDCFWYIPDDLCCLIPHCPAGVHWEDEKWAQYIDIVKKV